MYLPALEGVKKHVVDVDIPFDKPVNCDISIDTEKQKPESVTEEIVKKLKLL